MFQKPSSTCEQQANYIYLNSMFYSNSYHLQICFALSYKHLMMPTSSSAQRPTNNPTLSQTAISKSKNNEKVKVILRIRPFESDEDSEEFLTFSQQSEPNVVQMNKVGFETLMRFNYVQKEQNDQQSMQFLQKNDDSSAAQKNGSEDHQQLSVLKSRSQEKIFASIQQSVECIFHGVNSTIFAYGQTGSGKTYTIVGDCPQIQSETESYRNSLTREDRGVLPRALQRIFQEQALKKDSRISISFYEIYNEKIYDLLNPSPLKPLQIRQGRYGQLLIPQLTSIQVIDTKNVLLYLAEGIKNRATSSTKANIKSSRSHSIFHIKYERLIVDDETGEYEVSIANLRIVDLAGSEKFNIPHDCSPSEKEVKLLELKSINGSLSKLGHCISALGKQSNSQQQRIHVPFRDSKLTRILSDSLMGSGQIRLIVCVSPSISSMNETSSTLQFADRVKKAVFERPAVTFSNEKIKNFTDQQFYDLQEQLTEERQKRMELEGMVKDLLQMLKDADSSNQVNQGLSEGVQKKTRDIFIDQILKENQLLKIQLQKLEQKVQFLQQQNLEMESFIGSLSKKVVSKVSSNKKQQMLGRSLSKKSTNKVSKSPLISKTNGHHHRQSQISGHLKQSRISGMIQNKSSSISPSRSRSKNLPIKSSASKKGTLGINKQKNGGDSTSKTKINGNAVKPKTHTMIRTPPKTQGSKSVNDLLSEEQILSLNEDSVSYMVSQRSIRRSKAHQTAKSSYPFEHNRPLNRIGQKALTTVHQNGFSSEQKTLLLQEKVRERLQQIKQQLQEEQSI